MKILAQNAGLHQPSLCPCDLSLRPYVPGPAPICRRPYVLHPYVFDFTFDVSLRIRSLLSDCKDFSSSSITLGQNL